jgi:hypothetical protein
MPENELAISYIEVVKLVKATSKAARLKQLKADIDADKTGIVYAYRKGSVAFEIKRYRTGRFIKKAFNC